MFGSSTVQLSIHADLSAFKNFGIEQSVQIVELIQATQNNIESEHILQVLFVVTLAFG